MNTAEDIFILKYILYFKRVNITLPLLGLLFFCANFLFILLNSVFFLSASLGKKDPEYDVRIIANFF